MATNDGITQFYFYLHSLNDIWKLYPFAFIAHAAWLGFWLALAILVFLPGKVITVNILPTRLLVFAFLGSAIWRALLAVTSGPSPILMRDESVGPLRLLDLTTAIIAWVWLIIVLRRVVRIEENCPHGTA